MESTKFNSIKRRLENMYSPEIEMEKPSKTRMSTNKTFKKLQFTPEPVENFDENSCDSGFSEIKEEEVFQDDFDVRSEADIDLDTFEIDTFNGVYSPVCAYDRVTRFDDSKDVKHLKKKSNSYNYAPIDREEFNHEAIKQSLEFHDESRELIGDMSRNYTLPTLKVKRHNDLATINPETMVDLINGKYSDKIGKFMILDARYPYEYEGGHIDGAESAFSKDKLFSTLFENPITSADNKPFVIVIHCEFSIERGPKLMREIREKDRSLNKDNYPNLYYPEIYLLEGGYKNFYEQFEQFCEPRNYMPMIHDNHKNDLKFFRKKSKTWSEISTNTITKVPTLTKNNKRQSKFLTSLNDENSNSIKKTKTKLSF